MNAAVILINPKTPYNVGSVIRACSIFDVPTVRWTGDRVHANKAGVKAGTTFSKRRLPREERMKDYTQVDWCSAPETVIDSFVEQEYTPVAVEVRDASEYLDEFVHPERAVYVFGPEDGSLSKGVLTACHRFVRVRTANRTPLNLAMAVNVVLHDRFIKETARRFEPVPT